SSIRNTCPVRPRSIRARTSWATSAWTRSALLVALVACRGAAMDLPDAATSPQASAEPAPLANVPASPSASPPTAQRVEALRSDRPLDVDSPRETPAHELGVKELLRD